MPSSIIYSGLLVGTALDIYIPSGIAQHDSECHVELDNRIATEGKKENVLNRVLNFNLHTMNLHMKAEGK